MIRKRLTKVTAVLFTLFIMVAVLAGCKTKSVKIDLPKGVSLVDTSLNASSLKLNTNVDLRLIAEEGEVLEKLEVNGEDVTLKVDNGKFTVKVTKNLTIKVSWKKLEFKLVLPKGVVVDKPKNLDLNKVKHGTSITLLATPQTGELVKEFKVNDEVKTLTNNKYTFTLTKDTHVKIVFEDADYTITYVVNNGLFTFTQPVKYNTIITQRFIGDLIGNRYIAKWTLDDDEISFPFVYNYDKNITLKREISEQKNISYDIVDGKAVIKNIGVLMDEKIAILPEKVGNYEITATKDTTNAFLSTLIDKKVRFVALPKKLKILGKNAFVGTDVEEIVFPETLEKIGTHALSKTRLKSVNLPSSLQKIEGFAFVENYDLQSVTFGDECALTIIERDAFSKTAIENIKLPKNVKKIGDFVFANTFNLKSIEVEEGNTSYKSKNGILFSGDFKQLTAYPSGKKETSYIVDENVTIAWGAFFGNRFLKEITLPKTTKVISGYAFYEMLSLEKINIPDDAELSQIQNFAFTYTNIKTFRITKNLTNISQYAFNCCDNLAAFEIASENKKFKVIDGALYSDNGDTLLICPGGKTGTFKVDSNATKIAKHAFYELKKLDTVVIHENVKVIEEGAFRKIKCRYLIVPSTVTTIAATIIDFTNTPVYTDAVNATSAGWVANWAEVSSIYYKNQWSLVDGVPMPK